MRNFGSPAGATPIDPDDMAGLRIRHITSREEVDRWEQDNINDALNWLEKRRKSDILTIGFLTTLHTKMFGKVWKWAGEFRRSGKNIGVDWTQVPTQLAQLLDDVRYWIEHKTYGEDEIAARFHHRLVWIHPFVNGNGRHARLMTDILLEEVLNREPFSWGMIGESDPSEVRRRYLSALRAADSHDLSELMAFVRPPAPEL